MLPGDDGHVGLAPIRSYKPNDFELYDLNGNVWEWVWDSYSRRTRGSHNDVDPPNHSGSYRVIKGGSWHSWPDEFRIDFRERPQTPWGRWDQIGFRIVLGGSQWEDDELQEINNALKELVGNAHKAPELISLEGGQYERRVRARP